MSDLTFDQVIRTRRTTREYRDEPVPEGLLQELVELATLAPSGMNAQPWRFSVVTNKGVLREVNARVKSLLLARNLPYLTQYEAMFQDPEFSIFWGAPALIVIQGVAGSPIAPSGLRAGGREPHSLGPCPRARELLHGVSADRAGRRSRRARGGPRGGLRDDRPYRRGLLRRDSPIAAGAGAGRDNLDPIGTGPGASRNVA